jgi:hypothetical protein
LAWRSLLILCKTTSSAQGPFAKGDEPCIIIEKTPPNHTILRIDVVVNGVYSPLTLTLTLSPRGEGVYEIIY